jgi:hypothetical protein
LLIKLTDNPGKWSQLILDNAFDALSEEAQVSFRDFCNDMFKEEFVIPAEGNCRRAASYNGMMTGCKNSPAWQKNTL